MVGMLQILTYLMCIYLVYKAIEILMIAYVSLDRRREGAVQVAIVLLVLTVLIACGFILWIDSQAKMVSDSISR